MTLTNIPKTSYGNICTLIMFLILLLMDVIRIQNMGGAFGN